MSKKQALILQNIGMVLIVGIMTIDHFLFAVQEEMILVCAILSALLLIMAIYVRKKHEQDTDRQSKGRPE